MLFYSDVHTIYMTMTRPSGMAVLEANSKFIVEYRNGAQGCVYPPVRVVVPLWVLFHPKQYSVVDAVFGIFRSIFYTVKHALTTRS